MVAAGLRVRVRCTGRGPPLLLLHGNPDTGDLWSPLAERLAPRWRCLAPDLPGFGATPAPVPFRPDFEDYARFVHALVVALGLDEPVALAVHDVGAFYGLPFAVRHPARVRALVMFNTPFDPDYRWHRWARLWRTPLAGEAAMRLLDRRVFRAVIRRASPGLPPDYVDGAYRHYGAATRRVVLAMYRAAAPRRFEPWLAAVRDLTERVPATVLWGERDPFVPARFSRSLGPRARVRRYPEHGHWLPREAPDEVARDLAPWLRSALGERGATPAGGALSP